MALSTLLIACGDKLDSAPIAGGDDTAPAIDSEDTGPVIPPDEEWVFDGLLPSVAAGEAWPDFSVQLLGVDPDELDDQEVTISVSGAAGELQNAEAEFDSSGVATFEGVAFSGCGLITLTATAGARAGDAAPLSVDARLSLAEAVSNIQWLGSAFSVSLTAADFAGEFIDGVDVPLTLRQVGGTGALAEGAEITAEMVDGEVTFEPLTPSAGGTLDLEISADLPCDETLTLPTLLAGAGEDFHPVFLQGARAGVEYLDALPGDVDSDYIAIAGSPPYGTEMAPDGAITGTPAAAGLRPFEVAALHGDRIRRLSVQLPVYPDLDEDIEPSDDPVYEGDWDTTELLLTIPEITNSYGTFYDVPLLLTVPAERDAVVVEPGDTGCADTAIQELDDTGDTAGPIYWKYVLEMAEGTFPLIAFHHAAHDPADIYDSYTDLHHRWASHGVIVASVDGSALTDGEPQSWDNLEALSSFQRAAIDFLKAETLDAASALYDRIDAERVVVAGHSRGGAASLLSLWDDPSLLGAISFQGVSPLQSPGQDWVDPARNSDRPLAPRPILFFSAAGDRDESYPMVDVSYEQRAGPTSFVTIEGANHEDTYDEDTPGGTTSASDITVDERHDIDQRYSVAFIKRFVEGDLEYDALLFGRTSQSADIGLGVVAHSDRFMNTALSVDAFQGDDGVNDAGGANAGAGLDIDGNAPVYQEGLDALGVDPDAVAVIDGWGRAREISWSGGAGSLSLDLGGAVNLSGQRHLVFRVMSACDPPGWGTDPGCEDPVIQFDATLYDGSGSDSVNISEGLGDLGVLGRHWTNVRLDLDDYAGVDLTDVRSITLEFDDPLAWGGHIWIDDLRFE